MQVGMSGSDEWAGKSFAGCSGRIRSVSRGPVAKLTAARAIWLMVPAGGQLGGPLVNRAGDVFAINTAIIPSAHGVGFAIPTST